MPFQDQKGINKSTIGLLDEAEKAGVAGMMLLALSNLPVGQATDYSRALTRSLMSAVMAAAFETAANAVKEKGAAAADDLKYLADISGEHYNKQRNMTLLMAETLFENAKKKGTK